MTFLLLLALPLLSDPAVQSALTAIQNNEPEISAEQIRVCEIPAPPFHEQQRGLELKRLFEQLRLADVHIDQAGNVIGTRPGANPHPSIVLAAHSLNETYDTTDSYKGTQRALLLVLALAQ